MPVHTIKWIVDTHICDLCLPSTMVGAVLWDVLCFFGLQNNSHSHVPSMLMWTPQSSKMSSCDPQGSPGEVWTCHCYYTGIKCVHTSKACWPGRQLPQLIPKGESNRSAKGSWSLLVVHGYIYTLISSSVSFWRTLHYKHEPSGECVLTALDPGSGGSPPQWANHLWRSLTRARSRAVCDSSFIVCTIPTRHGPPVTRPALSHCLEIPSLKALPVGQVFFLATTSSKALCEGFQKPFPTKYRRLIEKEGDGEKGNVGLEMNDGLLSCIVWIIEKRFLSKSMHWVIALSLCVRSIWALFICMVLPCFSHTTSWMYFGTF